MKRAQWTSVSAVQYHYMNSGHLLLVLSRLRTQWKPSRTRVVASDLIRRIAWRYPTWNLFVDIEPCPVVAIVRDPPSVAALASFGMTWMMQIPDIALQLSTKF